MFDAKNNNNYKVPNKGFVITCDQEQIGLPGT
jgi:hypothetical protein